MNLPYLIVVQLDISDLPFAQVKTTKPIELKLDMKTLYNVSAKGLPRAKVVK